MNITNINFDKTPLESMEIDEYNFIIEKFCSLICILTNKKMNYPSIFVTVAETPEFFKMYKRLCGFDDSREAIMAFLKFDETIVKSKFLKRVIDGGRFS